MSPIPAVIFVILFEKRRERLGDLGKNVICAPAGVDNPKPLRFALCQLKVARSNFFMKRQSLIFKTTFASRPLSLAAVLVLAVIASVISFGLFALPAVAAYYHAVRCSRRERSGESALSK